MGVAQNTLTVWNPETGEFERKRLVGSQLQDYTKVDGGVVMNDDFNSYEYDLGDKQDQKDDLFDKLGDQGYTDEEMLAFTPDELDDMAAEQRETERLQDLQDREKALYTNEAAASKYGDQYDKYVEDLDRFKTDRRRSSEVQGRGGIYDMLKDNTDRGEVAAFDSAAFDKSYGRSRAVTPDIKESAAYEKYQSDLNKYYDSDPSYDTRSIQQAPKTATTGQYTQQAPDPAKPTWAGVDDKYDDTSAYWQGQSEKLDEARRTWDPNMKYADNPPGEAEVTNSKRAKRKPGSSTGLLNSVIDANSLGL